MNRAELEVHPIPVRGASPWTFRQRIGLFLWHFAWPLLCGWTPKPFNAWRLFWLRVFGCRIHGTPFVHQGARIQIPWHVILNDRSNVGDRTNLYSLGEIELGPKCVVAQEAYLCTGTHDFQDPTTPLATAKIRIGTDAFVGARTFVLPGVTIGDGAVVGACSLVTRNVESGTVVAGSPARFIRFKEPVFVETAETN